MNCGLRRIKNGEAVQTTEKRFVLNNVTGFSLREPLTRSDTIKRFYMPMVVCVCQTLFAAMCVVYRGCVCVRCACEYMLVLDTPSNPILMCGNTDLWHVCSIRERNERASSLCVLPVVSYAGVRSGELK